MNRAIITIILAAGLFAAKAFAQEALPVTIESGSVTYTITSAYLANHFENIEPAEETEYLIIRMTAKNSSAKKSVLVGYSARTLSLRKAASNRM